MWCIVSSNRFLLQILSYDSDFLPGFVICKLSAFLVNSASCFIHWTWVAMYSQRFLHVFFPLRSRRRLPRSTWNTLLMYANVRLLPESPFLSESSSSLAFVRSGPQLQSPNSISRTGTTVRARIAQNIHTSAGEKYTIFGACPSFYAARQRSSCSPRVPSPSSCRSS